MVESERTTAYSEASAKLQQIKDLETGNKAAGSDKTARESEWPSEAENKIWR